MFGGTHVTLHMEEPFEGQAAEARDDVRQFASHLLWGFAPEREAYGTYPTSYSGDVSYHISIYARMMFYDDDGDLEDVYESDSSDSDEDSAEEEPDLCWRDTVDHEKLAQMFVRNDVARRFVGADITVSWQHIISAPRCRACGWLEWPSLGQGHWPS